MRDISVADGEIIYINCNDSYLMMYGKLEYITPQEYNIVVNELQGVRAFRLSQ